MLFRSILKFYIENYIEFEDIAIKATQVLIYIGNYEENMRIIKDSAVLNSVMNVAYQMNSIHLKRVAAECLTQFMKDIEMRVELEQDIRVKELMMELISDNIDPVYQENLLHFFLNLLESITFKKLLFDDGILDVILDILYKSQNELCIIYALKVAGNVAYRNCPVSIFKKLSGPLMRILKISKNTDITVQVLASMQILIESDAGRSIHEFKKLLFPILGCIRSVEDEIICHSLQVLYTLIKYGGQALLSQAVINGEPIKVCVLLFCTHTNPLMISISKTLILDFARNGYAKEIGEIGKITIAEKLFLDITLDDLDEKRESLEIIAYLTEYKDNREYICSVEKIKKYISQLIGILTLPIPLSEDEM